MKVLGISAGTSETSASTRLAQKVADAAEGGAEIIGLKPYARDIADAITRGYPSERLAKLFDAVDKADALVAVTPIYNAMPSGLFISFFDVLPEETLQGKPMALGATGGSPRHSLVIEQAMRPMFVYMHAMVPTTAVYAATEDWGAPGEGFEGSTGRTLGNRILREGQELANLVAVAKGLTPNHGPAQGELDEAPQAAEEHPDRSDLSSAEDAAIANFPDFVPFDQLLK